MMQKQQKISASLLYLCKDCQFAKTDRNQCEKQSLPTANKQKYTQKTLSHKASLKYLYKIKSENIVRPARSVKVIHNVDTHQSSENLETKEHSTYSGKKQAIPCSIKNSLPIKRQKIFLNKKIGNFKDLAKKFDQKKCEKPKFLEKRIEYDKNIGFAEIKMKNHLNTTYLPSSLSNSIEKQKKQKHMDLRISLGNQKNSLESLKLGKSKYTVLSILKTPEKHPSIRLQQSQILLNVFNATETQKQKWRENMQSCQSLRVSPCKQVQQ